MINSEDDLWRLFEGTDPQSPGEKQLTFRCLVDQTSVLDVRAEKPNSRFRPRFEAKDLGRYYKLRCLKVEAVVNQARLFATARRMGDPDLVISYLGARIGE